MSMTPAQVATSLGGDVFIFDYAHADVADSTTLSSGNWGLRKVDGTLSLTDAVRPGVASDGVTSLAGAVTFSINTFQLETFVSAHVHTEGSGFTVTYTKDGGTTWTALAEDGAFALTNTDDLDIKVSFPGGIQNDTSQLTSLTVYVMKTESIKGPSRALTCSAPSMITSDGLKLTQTASIPLYTATNATVPSGTIVGTPSTVGTVEMWVRLDVSPTTWSAIWTGSEGWVGATQNGTVQGSSGGSANPSYPDGPYYIDGVAASANADHVFSSGQFHHLVFPYTGPPLNDWADFAGVVQDGQGDRFHTAMTISHLAFYSQVMTADEIASLYLYSSGGGQTVTISDSDAVRVTEYPTPVNIYAYAWSIVSGNQS